MGSHSTRSRSSASLTDYILLLILLLLLAFIAMMLAMSSAGHRGGVGAPVAISLATTPPAALPTRTDTPLPKPTDTPIPTSTPIPSPLPIAQPTATLGAFAFNAPPPAPLRAFKENVINVVLIGTDTRTASSVGRSDVVIIASIDPDVPAVTMLSLPRDLYVYIPNYQWERINVAEVHGERNGSGGRGADLLKQTIQYNFGIPVQYYARVDFTGFKRIVDTVGGVDVIADCALYDEFPDLPDSHSDLLAANSPFTPVGAINIPIAGVYHLDGKHALWYARSRSSSNDFDRTRRQQRVLRAVWEAIRQRNLAPQLPSLWGALTQTVETDLTLNDVIYLAHIAAQIQPAQMRSRFLDGSHLREIIAPGGAQVLAYDYATLQPYLDETFAPLPPNIAAQATGWVDVRNGATRTDWDRVAADRLIWAGYPVESWGPADQPYPRSMLIDYSASPKGSRAADLAALFNIAPDNIIHQPDPDSTVAQRIIVGQDWDPCWRRARFR
jgi:LCP family protein required for cell wall assembly